MAERFQTRLQRSTWIWAPPARRQGSSVEQQMIGLIVVIAHLMTPGCGVIDSSTNDSAALSDGASVSDNALRAAADPVAASARGCVGGSAYLFSTEMFDQAFIDHARERGCVATPNNCSASCKLGGGRCCQITTENGEMLCIALTDADCAGSQECIDTGACFAHCGACVAMFDDDCALASAAAIGGPIAHRGKCLWTEQACYDLDHSCKDLTEQGVCWLTPLAEMHINEGARCIGMEP